VRRRFFWLQTPPAASPARPFTWTAATTSWGFNDPSLLRSALAARRPSAEWIDVGESLDGTAEAVPFRKLKFFAEFAAGAGNIDPAGEIALAVLQPFDDAGGLAALGAIGALGSVHYLLAVCCFGNLRHCSPDGLRSPS